MCWQGCLVLNIVPVIAAPKYFHLVSHAAPTWQRPDFIIHLIVFLLSRPRFSFSDENPVQGQECDCGWLDAMHCDLRPVIKRKVMAVKGCQSRQVTPPVSVCQCAASTVTDWRCIAHTPKHTHACRNACTIPGMRYCSLANGETEGRRLSEKQQKASVKETLDLCVCVCFFCVRVS